LSISAAVLAAAAPQRRRRAALVISALTAGLAAAAATACSTARAAADATEATAADATEAVASAVGQIAATPHAAASSAQGSTKEREVDRDSSAKDSFDDVQRLPAHTAFPIAPSCPMAAHPLLLPADTEVFDGMNAEGEAQAVADRAWLRLKRFSLLTVREVRGERTGSAPLSLLACKGSP
jgi:hypothetical protein